MTDENRESGFASRRERAKTEERTQQQIADAEHFRKTVSDIYGEAARTLLKIRTKVNSVALSIGPESLLPKDGSEPAGAKQTCCELTKAVEAVNTAIVSAALQLLRTAEAAQRGEIPNPKIWHSHDDSPMAGLGMLGASMFGIGAPFNIKGSQTGRSKG